MSFPRIIAALLLIWTQGLLLQARQPEPDFGKLSLDQLTERAAVIVVSTVTSRHAEWEHYGSSRLIITKVTMEVEQSLKGSAPRTLTVEVLGGTIGDETLRVSHVPEFRVGDRDVLFLNNAPHAVSPLVGSDQGRVRVMNEAGTGTARMLTVGFAPLVSVEAIGSTTSAQGDGGLVRSMSAALSLSDFVTLVRDRVRQLERRR